MPVRQIIIATKNDYRLSKIYLNLQLFKCHTREKNLSFKTQTVHAVHAKPWVVSFQSYLDELLIDTIEVAHH